MHEFGSSGRTSPSVSWQQNQMAQAPPMLVIAVYVSFTEFGMSELLSVFERIAAFILTIPQQICEQVWRNGLHESHKYTSKHNFTMCPAIIELILPWQVCGVAMSVITTFFCHVLHDDIHGYVHLFRANMGLTNYLYNGCGIFWLCTLFHMFKSVRNLVICLKLSVASWWHIAQSPWGHIWVMLIGDKALPELHIANRATRNG